MLFCFVYADDDEHHHYRKDFSYLSLSKEQKSVVKKILKEYQEELREYRHIKYKLVEKKQNLFLDSNFDAQKLEMLNETINEKKSKVELKLLKNLHKVLSKEQKYKFIHYLEEWEIE